VVALTCPFLASLWRPGGKGVTSSCGEGMGVMTPWPLPGEGMRVMTPSPLPGSDLPRGPAAAHGEEHQNGCAVHQCE